MGAGKKAGQWKGDLHPPPLTLAEMGEMGGTLPDSRAVTNQPAPTYLLRSHRIPRDKTLRVRELSESAV